MTAGVEIYVYDGLVVLVCAMLCFVFMFFALYALFYIRYPSDKMKIYTCIYDRLW